MPVPIIIIWVHKLMQIVLFDSSNNNWRKLGQPASQAARQMDGQTDTLSHRPVDVSCKYWHGLYGSHLKMQMVKISAQLISTQCYHPETSPQLTNTAQITTLVRYLHTERFITFLKTTHGEKLQCIYILTKCKLGFLANSQCKSRNKWITLNIWKWCLTTQGIHQKLTIEWEAWSFKKWIMLFKRDCVVE